MDLLLLLKAAIMGLVEGATEFLPVSSTGHLILAGDLLNFMDHDKRGVFEIAIQLGAILAVVWEYRTRFASTFAGIGRDPIANPLIINLAIAFLPLAVLGLAFGDTIKEYLFKPVPVAIAFIVGAFIILWAEKRKHTVTIETVDDIRPLDALKLGFAQAVALDSGHVTFRFHHHWRACSLGYRVKQRQNFRFSSPCRRWGLLRCIPCTRNGTCSAMDDMGAWAVGFVFAFISAMIAVRALIRYVSHHDFTIFAWYRIAFGVIVLITAYTGLVEWTVH